MILDLLWWLGWAATAALVALPLLLLKPLGVAGGVAAWALLVPWTTLAALAAIHRLLPASEAGTFRLPGDPGATRWAMKGWAPSVYLTLFQPLFFQSTGFQRLVLRAFGAQLGEGAWITSRTIAREPHHLAIGARTMVGEFAHLACSLQPRNGILLVAPITIGDDTMVGGYVNVAPGARIGSGCLIEHRVAIGPMVQVGDGARIGAGSALYASARIGRGAVLGKHCVIPAHAVVEAGAVLPDGTVLAAPPRGRMAVMP